MPINECTVCGKPALPGQATCSAHVGGAATRARPLADWEDPTSISQPPKDKESLAPLAPPTRGAPVDSLAGMRLGEYVIKRKISAGGMGVVYEGEQPVIGKRVAVKVLLPAVAEDETNVKRMLSEARAVNAIRHRGIVDIFSFGDLPDGRPYMVMEYLEGVPLSTYIFEQKHIEAVEALGIMDEALSALSAAHSAGVIHRDLKPSNIFICRQPDGTRFVKVLDFGIAKLGASPTSSVEQTRKSMIIGTPDYMAPEQARGEAISAVTDIYAMGVVLFEMLTGRCPFVGKSVVELLMAQLEQEPPRPSSLVATVPPEVDELVLKMLRKDPKQRPQTASALREEVEAIRAEVSTLNIPRGQVFGRQGMEAGSDRRPKRSSAPVDTVSAVRTSGTMPGRLLAGGLGIAVASGVVWAVVSAFSGAQERVVSAEPQEAVAGANTPTPPPVGEPPPRNAAPQEPVAPPVAPRVVSPPSQPVVAAPGEATKPSKTKTPARNSRVDALSRRLDGLRDRLSSARRQGKNVGLLEKQVVGVEKALKGKLSSDDYDELESTIVGLERQAF